VSGNRKNDKQMIVGGNQNKENGRPRP